MSYKGVVLFDVATRAEGPSQKRWRLEMGNQAAIETLERRLAEVVRKANALVDVINDLRREDGLPPRPPFGGGNGGGGGNETNTGVAAPLAQIKPDTFYGKKMQTAVRE